MSDYTRPRAPGACIFFTVCLADRSSDLLVREVDRLRTAVRETMAERPFVIEASVVLPDHLHMIWRLPEGDVAYGQRWGAIKSRFSRSYLRTLGWPKKGWQDRSPGFTPAPRLPVVQSGRYAGMNPGLRVDKGEVGIWQRRFWEHHIRDERDYETHVRYCWANPVKHGLVARAVEWPHSSIHRDIRAGRVEAEWRGDVADGMFGE